MRQMSKFDSHHSLFSVVKVDHSHPNRVSVSELKVELARLAQDSKAHLLVELLANSQEAYIPKVKHFSLLSYFVFRP